ncbi:hypothetical protein D3C77_559350 [compost metagenome]
MNDAFDFFASADDRVEIALFGRHRQVAGQAVEGWRIYIRLVAVMTGNRLAASKQLQHLLARFVQADAEVVQHARSHALAFPDQAEQNMLCAYIRMTQLTGLIHGQLDNFLRSRCIGNIRRLLLSAAD